MPTIIPVTENERLAWTLNFEDQFPPIAASLGFSSLEIDSLMNDCAMMRFVIVNNQASTAFSKTCTAFKNEMLGGVGENVNQPQIPVYQQTAPPNMVKAGILERLNNAIQRAKLSSNFNQSIAGQLMITTAETIPLSPADGKPKANGTAITGSIVRIDWTKGKFDGVFIDSQRGDETDWTRLDFDMRSPYEDVRPPLAIGKPEERRYRLIYFIDNKPVGNYSDTINVITLP